MVILNVPAPRNPRVLTFSSSPFQLLYRRWKDTPHSWSAVTATARTHSASPSLPQPSHLHTGMCLLCLYSSPNLPFFDILETQYARPLYDFQVQGVTKETFTTKPPPLSSVPHEERKLKRSDTTEKE